MITIHFGVEPDIQIAFGLEEVRSFTLPDGSVYAVVAHNKERRLVHDVWVGDFDDQTAFRAVLSYILELMRTGDYAYWLADIRHLSTSFIGSNAWLVHELMPAVIAAGLVREAVVVPDEVAAPEGFDVLGAATAALREIADGRVRGFRDIKVAKRWLFEGDLLG